MDNRTSEQRLRDYVEADDFEKAEALVAVVEYLEECLLWDIEFEDVEA
jgi:hypothetical protein